MTHAAPTPTLPGAGSHAASDSESSDVARESLAVAAATAASRITGLGRLAAIAAVLGPTYMGNTFQAVNLLPNAVYEFLAGSLLVNLLVPPLVRHIAQKNIREAERLAGGFLGVATLAMSGVLGVLLLARPLLLRAFTAGVPDPAVAAAQRTAGSVLLLLVLPQIVLYVIAGTAGALLNARGRSALPAGAPAIENVGVIVTVIVAGSMFGNGISVGQAPIGFLILLGAGSTASAALHAAVVWIGCRLDGVHLRMRAGWRDPEVRAVVRDTVPTIGQAGLNALWPIVGLGVANAIAGGVVAFQFALTFSYLPSALGARAVGASTLRRLAAKFHASDDDGFRYELSRAFALTAFLAVPAAVGYLVLATPLVRAVSFGEMAAPRAVDLVAVALMALAPGVIAEAGFLLATSAAFSRGDPRAPFRSMAIRGVITVGGMLAAGAYLRGTQLLFCLGLAVSVGTLVGTIHLMRRLGGARPAGRDLGAPIARAFFASAWMAGALLLFIPALHSTSAWDTGLLVRALLVGGVVYLAAQWRLGGPEFAAFRSLFRVQRQPRTHAQRAEPAQPTEPAPPAQPQRVRRARRTGPNRWAGLVIAGAAILGLCAAIEPLFTIVALVGGGLFVGVLLRPAWAAYLLIAVTPLVVGMDRGTVLPLIRPSEAVLLLVAVPLTIRLVVERIAGRRRSMRFHQIDKAIGVLALTGSLVPLLMMLAKGQPVATDDLLYSLVLWKYAALYLVMRTAVRTDDEMHEMPVVVDRLDVHRGGDRDHAGAWHVRPSRSAGELVCGRRHGTTPRQQPSERDDREPDRAGRCDGDPRGGRRRVAHAQRCGQDVAQVGGDPVLHRRVRVRSALRRHRFGDRSCRRGRAHAPDPPPRHRVDPRDDPWDPAAAPGCRRATRQTRSDVAHPAELDLTARQPADVLPAATDIRREHRDRRSSGGPDPGPRAVAAVGLHRKWVRLDPVGRGRSVPHRVLGLCQPGPASDRTVEPATNRCDRDRGHGRVLRSRDRRCADGARPAPHDAGQRGRYVLFARSRDERSDHRARPTGRIMTKPRACIIRHRDYELQVRREAEALRDAGFDVDVIGIREQGHGLVEIDDGVRIIRLPVSRERGSRARYVFDYALFFVLVTVLVGVLHVQRRYAVVQTNSMPDFLVFTAIVPRLLGAKIVAFMKEPTPEIAEMKFGPGLMTNAIAWVEQLSLRFAHLALTVTDQLKEAYVQRGADPSKIRVVLNGHDPAHMPRPSVTPDPTTFTLICHGTIEERYGHETLIRAVHLAHAEVPEVRLHITGNGTGLDRVLTLIDELNAGDYITYLGYIPLDELWAALARADVGVVPMRKSGYSDLVHTNKMFDFMALSKPVIATRLRAVEAYLGDGAVAFVESDDAPGMAAAIIDLYRHPEKRAGLVARSRELFERFGWPEQRRLYQQAFADLLETAPSRGKLTNDV